MGSALSYQALKLSALSCSCILTQYWTNSEVRRYTQDNYNLNLSYITQNVIAMANPGKNKFSMTENIKSQVEFSDKNIDNCFVFKRTWFKSENI